MKRSRYYLQNNACRKRGLLKDTLSVIVAVIGLALLGIGLYKLFVLISTSKSEVAKQSLNVVEAKLAAITEGESTRFALRGPAEWVLIGWSAADASKPARCLTKSCLCACPYDRRQLFAIENEATQCQKGGICRTVEADTILIREHYYSNNLPVTSPYVTFSKNLIELSVRKQRGSIEIVYNNSGRKEFYAE